MEISIPDLPTLGITSVSFTDGGIKFKDAAPSLASVVDNGICPDDPRVMMRTNEATKIVLDTMIPVGGMATYNVAAVDTVLVLPPQLENCIEAYPAGLHIGFTRTPGVVRKLSSVYGDTDIMQGWYEIVNNSVYIDPFQHHDNPLVDMGDWPDATDNSLLRRLYTYPGLQPTNAIVTVTGAKRFIPIKSDEDYLIVQNIEALKYIILSIERNENSAPDEAPKYRQQAMELLQSEVKKHLLDPRNYMRRKSAYQQDTIDFHENTFGWTRANIALDIEEAMKTGKIDLTWSINQAERRLMTSGKIYKDMVSTIQATVVGGDIYFPLNVGAVLAIDIEGRPIPVRSQFFQQLENGPGGFPAYEMLIDQGDEYLPSTQSLRRKYKLVTNCQDGQLITAVCQLRWLSKKPHDLMTIKNYEAIRLMMTAKFQNENKPDQTVPTAPQMKQLNMQESNANEQAAFRILDNELHNYLAGIRFTPHIQTGGFGLGDVGGYWTL